MKHSLKQNFESSQFQFWSLIVHLVFYVVLNSDWSFTAYAHFPLSSQFELYVDCRLFEYLADNALNFPVIHHIQFPSGTDR